MTPQKSLNPAWAGAVRAEVNASPHFVDQSMALNELAWGQVRVESQDGALLAQGTVTVRALPGEPLSGLGELPDKVGG